jgi:hypothetical protein
MTFAAGAWIAGIAGCLAGVFASRLEKASLTGMGGVVDALFSGSAGVVLALLSYGLLAILEGWSAFFQRRASPWMPLLFTLAMLAGALLAMRLTVGRRSGSAD